MNEKDVLDALLGGFSNGSEPETPPDTDASPTDQQPSAPADLDKLLEELAAEKAMKVSDAADAAENTAVLQESEPEPIEAEAEIPPAEELPTAETETADGESAETEPATTESVETESVETEPTETAAPAETPEEMPIRLSVTEEPTQVIELGGADADREEAFDGQLTMDELAPPEEPTAEEPAKTAEAEDWQKQLEQTREEKIRDFQIKQNRAGMDFRYAGDAAPDELPAEKSGEQPEPVTEKPRFTEHFTDFSQAEDVRAELEHRYRSGQFRFWLAAAAELLLLWSEGTVMIFGQPAIAPSLFLILNIVLLTVMMALSFPMLRDGVIGLCKGNPNADTVPALVSAVAWLHAMLQWARLSALEAGEVPLFTALAGISILLSGIGRLAKLKRIRLNFTVAGRQREKFAASLIEDERTAVDIGRRAVATGTPRIAFFRPITFLEDFLVNSYTNDRYDLLLRRFLPVAAGIAAVIGVLAGVVAHSVFAGLTAVAAAVCVLLPAASLALNVPLLQECRRLLENGNMLCGFAAAERLGNIHGVTLDVADIYLHDSVMLHGIRTFGDARIDEAIMDAAAVAIRTEGPLAGLFRRIIEDKTEILPVAENLVFEQDMGFSGWVGGRRVLVGNRKLLENHGVDTPSGDYERRYKKDGRELVYLSVAGELSAMFIISYVTDPTVEDALHRLQKAHISLLVRSCDPNVTEESLCAGFRLDDFYVDLLSASAGRLYDTLRHNAGDRAAADATVNGTVAGIADLLTACRRLRRRGIFAMILQIVCGVIGAVACLAAALSGGVLPTPILFLIMLLSALLSVLLPQFRR